MKTNNSLSSTLHILLHMADAGVPLTSEQLAAFLDTNPVVVRKMLAGLRDHDIVTSEKGHNGGWKLARALNAITLYDIYLALGSPSLFAIGNRNHAPECLIEQGVNRTMNGAFTQAYELIIGQFKQQTLEEIGTEFLNNPPHT